MDTHNLATVITPNILKERTEKASIDESNFLAIEAVNLLIDYNDQMCEVSSTVHLNSLSVGVSTNTLHPVKVPEDLQYDTSLFNKESDITTKEILKRYGERSSNPPQHPLIMDPGKRRLDSHDSKPNGTRSGATPTPRASAPIITHVDNTEPPHSSTWPRESSVRHVQAPGGASYPAGTPDMTPPQAQFEYIDGRSPYTHQRIGSNDSQGSQDVVTPNRQSYRQPGWVAGVAAKGP